MVRYILCVLVAVLCLSCACVSGKEEQPQEDVLTSVATVGSHKPSKLTKVPQTLRRGMTPQEEVEAQREMDKEDEMARQKFLEESKKAAAALQGALEKSKQLTEKLEALKAEHGRAIEAVQKAEKESGCAPAPGKDATAEADAACASASAVVEARRVEAEKAAEVAAAVAAVREAERAVRDARAMDAVAKTAARNSQYVAIHTPLVGDGRSSITGSTAGMGRRGTHTDGVPTPLPTVMVSAVLLLLIAQALMS